MPRVPPGGVLNLAKKYQDVGKLHDLGVVRPDGDSNAAQGIDEEFFLGGDVCSVHVMMAVDNRAIFCGRKLSEHFGRTSE